MSGGESQRIIRGMDAWEPAISPDRKRLVFMHGGADVWVSDINGINAAKVATGATRGTPEFSGDGRFIYYWRNDGVWRVPVNGGKPERLNIKPDAVHGSVSPDGNWLIFRDDHGSKRIHLLPLPAGAPPRVFDVPRTSSGVYMRFHPSNRAFGFVDW